MAEWDKLRKETATEYQAFMDYCRMGPQRSIRKLAAHYAKQPIPLTKQTSMETYSKKNKWQERVLAWDADQSEIVNEKWLERRVAVREADWDVAEKLRKLALGILNESPNFMRTRRKLVKGKNGEPDREIVTVGLNLQQALQAVKLASELQRLSAEMPDRFIDVQSAGKALQPVIYLPKPDELVVSDGTDSEASISPD